MRHTEEVRVTRASSGHGSSCGRPRAQGENAPVPTQPRLLRETPRGSVRHGQADASVSTVRSRVCAWPGVQQETRARCRKQTSLGQNIN